MSVISSVKTYLSRYADLKRSAPVWIDFLGPKPPGYAIIPLAGTKITFTYIDGGSMREFPFAFQSMERTADELERIENNGFFEEFSDWLESQTAAGHLPTLAASKTAEEIKALGWAYLYQQGQSETGIYQIQCKLIYQQA